jgi:proline iminopeptidase
MSLSELKITEGYMPFLDYQVYYRIVGEKKENNKKPLLLLHGGPGSTHNCQEVLDKLSLLDDRQLIMYDQLGCGNSFVEGHPELWTLKTWINELKEIRKYLNLNELHILGHSWGGMLEIAYISDENPEGIKSAILSSTLSDSQLWGKEQHRRIKYLSQEDQDAIEKAEKTGNYNTPGYNWANFIFMMRHCNSPLDENSPECLRREAKIGNESYITAWGPNEFTPIGNLKDFNYTEKLRNWKVPSLIISGTSDLCTPLLAKTMYDRIPGARWELFEDSKHLVYVDQNEKYINLLIEWLNKYD